MVQAMPLKKPGKGRQRKSPTEILGVDFGSTGLKIVRMRNNKGQIALLAADILPPFEVPESATGHNIRLKVPKAFQANYTAMAVTGAGAAVRLLNMQGHVDAENLKEADVREQVGLSDEFRVSHVVLPLVRGKQETKVLVVGLPEKESKAVLSLVPYGPPAPCCLAISGLAAMTAFVHGPGADLPHDAVAVIESGAKITYMALFHKKTLALVRKFDFGADTIVARVQQQLGVDQETARGIIADGSFDISQPVHEVMDPFLRQLTISKDFVERREDCVVGAVYLSGGTTQSRYWMDEVTSAVGIDAIQWNPFEYVEVAPNAYPDELKGQESRFAAAIGACLGVFHGS